MLSVKKSLKRILIIIITVLIAFSAISMVATKLVYDGIFSRRDGEYIISDTLKSIVDNRTVCRYYSDDVKLTGYYYKSKSINKKDALVVIVPGFNEGADGYLFQIKSLLEYGWSVFAFDPTGSYSSKGDSTKGFPQVLCDIRATLDYIEKNDRYGHKNIAILGHSRGGYAACCALGYEYDISAVVSISGVNSAMEGVIGSSVDKIGNIAYVNYGFLWLYQAMLFGTDDLNASADEEISRCDVPVLIVHGSKDEQVPSDAYSIISHKDEIDSKNVEYIICSQPNQNGHTDLLFEEDGTANKKLMGQINNFLEKSIK